MNRLLYIDDTISNLEIFKTKFSNSFDISVSTNPSNIFNLLEGQKYDAILLEVHMPDKDGFQVLKEINESRFTSIPVIMFTSDEVPKIRYQALASEASDIIYRTYSDEEIQLRILNKIKLFSKINGEEKSQHITLGSLKLNLETSEAFEQEINLNLTPIEFRILAALVGNFPEKISRETMIKKAWHQEDVLDRTVNTHLCNLRSKLPKDRFTVESTRKTGVVLKKFAD